MSNNQKHQLAISSRVGLWLKMLLHLNRLSRLNRLWLEMLKAPIHYIVMALLFVFSFTTQNVFAEEASPPERAKQEASSSSDTNSSDSSNQEASPPERANQEASSKGFSTWDIQALYGSTFREPGVNRYISKGTITLENSASWSWGSSYFFVDYLRSNSYDQDATEFYAEWYPSASISKITCHDFCFPLMKDILITMGFNAGAKTTGAAPLVFLPGLTFDLDFPAFQFFSLGVYAYLDEGRINGRNNGSHTTTYQITPSWSLPFKLGCASFRFDGFVDFIGNHGQSAHQILAQPSLKLDVGNFFCAPNRLYTGVEWIYWKNKFGIKGFNENIPQAVVMWVF